MSVRVLALGGADLDRVSRFGADARALGLGPMSPSGLRRVLGGTIVIGNSCWHPYATGSPSRF